LHACEHGHSSYAFSRSITLVVAAGWAAAFCVSGGLREKLVALFGFWGSVLSGSWNTKSTSLYSHDHGHSSYAFSRSITLLVAAGWAAAFCVSGGLREKLVALFGFWGSVQSGSWDTKSMSLNSHEHGHSNSVCLIPIGRVLACLWMAAFCVSAFRKADGVAKPVVCSAGNARRADLKVVANWFITSKCTECCEKGGVGAVVGAGRAWVLRFGVSASRWCGETRGAQRRQYAAQRLESCCELVHYLQMHGML